jgi:hypothetical protein
VELVNRWAVSPVSMVTGSAASRSHGSDEVVCYRWSLEELVNEWSILPVSEARAMERGERRSVLLTGVGLWT